MVFFFSFFLFFCFFLSSVYRLRCLVISGPSTHDLGKIIHEVQVVVCFVDSLFPPKKLSKRTQGTAVTCSSRISRSKEVLDPATGFLAPGYTIADRFVENSGLPTFFVSRGHKINNINININIDCILNELTTCSFCKLHFL